MESFVLVKFEDSMKSYNSFVLRSKNRDFICHISIIGMWDDQSAIIIKGSNSAFTYHIMYNGHAYRQMGSSLSILLDEFDEEMDEFKAMTCFREILKQKFITNINNYHSSDIRQLSIYRFIYLSYYTILS